MKLIISHHKRIALIFAIILFIENCVLIYDNIQNKAPILGTRVEGKWLGLEGRANVTRFVKKTVDSQHRPLKFSYGNKIISIPQEDIGAKVNIPVVVNQIIQKGRTGNALTKFIEQNKTLIGLENTRIQGTVSPALMTIAILDIQKKIDTEALPKRPDLANDPSVVLPAKEGIKVQADKLSLLILQNIFNPPQDPIQIPTYKVFPNSYSNEDIKKVQSDFSKISLAPISISSGGFIFTLTSEDLKSLIKIAERPSPKNPKKSVLSIRIDDEKLSKKLGEFAKKVEETTRAEFDHHDAPVAIYSQFYSNTRNLIAIPTGNRISPPKRVLGIQTTLLGPKTAYLTFDDGPNDIYQPLILDILKTYDVKATFFMVGKNVQRYPNVSIRTVMEGHTVGNHSLNHSFLPNFNFSMIYNEILATNMILSPLTGSDTHLFRPPYGGVNATVNQAASNLGEKMYLWDVDPRDWSEPETEDLVNRVVNNTFDGADILLHSNHLATVKALPKIIEKLQAQGYVFKTLSN